MMPLDYVDYFQLKCAPFGQVASSDFFFTADNHERILDALYHVANNMPGLAVLTGAIGTGKTTMLRQLQRMLPTENYQVVTWVMHQPCTHAGELLRAVSQRLAIRVAGSDTDAMLWNIHRHVQSLHHQGRRLMLLVDEAQMLEGAETMEALRALLNLDCDGSRVVGVVLAGLDPLLQTLDAFDTVSARVTCRGELMPFSLQESLAYVHHRLAKAGARETTFSEDVLARVHNLSEGVPRAINTLCDNMLLRMARTGQKAATPELLDDVAQRLNFLPPDARAVQTRTPQAQTSKSSASADAATPVPSHKVDLLREAEDIAARLAGAAEADALMKAHRAPLPAETTVNMPGDHWQGVSAGDFLGNNTPAQGLDTRARARSDDEVVMAILGEAQRRFDQ